MSDGTGGRAGGISEPGTAVTTAAPRSAASTASPRSAASTASRVLDVAEALVQVRGFNGFSYADIAAELQITKASLHYHFATKADLGEALITRYAARFLEALAEMDTGGAAALAKLAAYAKLYADVLSQHKMCLCGMLAAEYPTLPPPMQTAVLGFFDENEAWLAAVLEQGRQEGSLEFSGPARDAARMIVSGLEGAMLVTRPYGDEARFRTAAASLLASVTAPPALPPRRRSAPRPLSWAGRRLAGRLRVPREPAAPARGEPMSPGLPRRSTVMTMPEPDNAADLGPAARRLADLVAKTPADALGRPTPCPAYSLGDLIDHVGGVALAFTAAARKERNAATDRPRAGAAARLGGDWRERIPRDLTALGEAWADPGAWAGMTRIAGDETPAEVVGLVLADELAVHGWDVARASGQAYACEPDILEAALRFLQMFASPDAPAGPEVAFGPARILLDEAPLLDRVVGLAGRDPGWSPG